MKDQKPLVSIIMGIYNCEDTLAQSIESILKQSYTNWELIMCDDCSFDKTADIAKEYCNKYPDKIILLKNKKNITLGPSLNRCIKRARGKFIARQDGDDISHEDRLERQVEFLENNKEYDLVGTAMIIFNELGVKGTRVLKSKPDAKDLMRGSIFAHATILMKKKVIKELKGYSDETNRNQVEDYDLWFRFIAKGYKGYNLSEELYYVREDINAYKRKSLRRRLNEFKVMRDGRKHLKLPLWYIFFLSKPIVTLLIPRRMLKFYHEFRAKVHKIPIKMMEMT